MRLTRVFNGTFESGSEIWAGLGRGWRNLLLHSTACGWAAVSCLGTCCHLVDDIAKRTTKGSLALSNFWTHSLSYYSIFKDTVIKKLKFRGVEGGREGGERERGGRDSHVSGCLLGEQKEEAAATKWRHVPAGLLMGQASVYRYHLVLVVERRSTYPSTSEPKLYITARGFFFFPRHLAVKNHNLGNGPLGDVRTHPRVAAQHQLGSKTL